MRLSPCYSAFTLAHLLCPFSAPPSGPTGFSSSALLHRQLAHLLRLLSPSRNDGMDSELCNRFPIATWRSVAHLLCAYSTPPLGATGFSSSALLLRQTAVLLRLVSHPGNDSVVSDRHTIASEQSLIKCPDTDSECLC
jgi:hypothetical protein